MVYTREFDKEFRHCDIHSRLSYPSRKLHILPFAGDSRQATFEVSCGDGSVYEFRCVKRDKKYPKPTISRGWSRLVKEKGLRVGDRLIFLMDREAVGPARYRIELQRRHQVMIFGVFHPTQDWYSLL